MSKSATKSLANTDRIRTILYVGVREFRIRSERGAGPKPTTIAALEQYANLSGLSRHRLHRFFYNQVGPSKEEDLDRISRGFISAMLWLAAFFKEKAAHCERLAYAETVACQLRERNRGKANCEPEQPAGPQRIRLVA